MTKKQKEKKLPPERPKIRGLRINEGSPLKEQLLKIVAAVKNDKSLDLQIRDGYLNIYYRGGSLLKISGFRGRQLSFKIAEKYFKRNEGLGADNSWLPKGDKDSHDVSLWLSVFDELKNTMNEWFVENKDNAERSMQQQLCSTSTQNPDSSWIVIDVEYAAWLHNEDRGRKLCRFDMIAVKRASLKSSKPLTIYVVEFKQGNKALKGVAGIESHAKDLYRFISGDEEGIARGAFKKSVCNILKEKSELGLLPKVDSVANFNEMDIKSLFLLHESTIPSELKIATERVLTDHGATPLFWELSSFLSK